MKKQHEYVLRAFLESAIPKIISRESPELIVIDSVLGGYCSQLLQGVEHINLREVPLITPIEKKDFSLLINKSRGEEKKELVVYYRLLILVEDIILQYQ